MKAALTIVIALAASPVEARPWQCVLWPNTCQMDQPPSESVPLPVPVPVERPPIVPPTEPTVAPAPARAPLVVHRAPKAAAKPVPAKKATPPKRIKSKFAKSKRRVATDPSWCSRVPSWASLEMIEAAATARGIAMTERQRQQARDCLATKKG